MKSGFSSTVLCDVDEPIDDTIPSPTRASTVSSPAPPTSCLIFARTVTRALAISWMPSLATAATGGVLITFGLTDICTASATLRPARSMAAAIRKSSVMLAFCAEIRAVTTLGTLPPARKCASRSLEVRCRPALVPAIIWLTMTEGGTLRNRISTSCSRLMRTPPIRGPKTIARSE